MLTNEEFHAWCLRNTLSPETEAYIQRIRTSQPVRKVRSGVSNITGRYPSVKMGRTIQFESFVELGAIYLMERDNEVLEFYDQPTRLQLHYHAKSGRLTTQWHTPDFLVLRRNAIGFDEWKAETALAPLAQRMPERYQPVAGGGWRCPPGEEAAQGVGVIYRVRSSDEYHPLFIQNLKFLQDFWVHPYPVTAEQEVHVTTLLTTVPGISLSQLLEAFPDLPVDVVFALLANSRIFTPLSSASLMQRDHVVLYLSDEEAERGLIQQVSSPALLPSFRHLRFDGRLWEVETQGEMVSLRPEVGLSIHISPSSLEHLLATGQAQEVADTTPSTLSEETRALLLAAGPKQLERADKRLSAILAYIHGEPITVSARAVQKWQKAYREAEARLGYGYFGLLDHMSKRGNRADRVEATSKDLLTEFLRTHYATPQAKRSSAVYALYREACARANVSPVSQATFYRERRRFSTVEVTATRHGKRAAYQERPWFYRLDQTTPRHGDRPFAIAHLDHTPLDIVLVSSITGKPLARPWLTFLIDAYSRRMLAAHVSYEEPSYRSVMMAFRLCVQRYGRLPQAVVVDHGPEFESVYFEALLAQCFITKVERPPHEPRAGAVVERLFGTTEAEFVQQLRGNTQASKVPRQMTREVDPKRLAVWTLEAFARRLTEYCSEVYDQMEHSALFMSPREAYARGMELAGARSHRIIAYSEAFLMQTRPTTRTGVAKIYRNRGITVNGLHYWHERMYAADVVGQAVPVRFEPFDMGIVYAYIDGQWLECIGDNYAQMHGRSEKEWNLISEEWREHQRQHSQKRQTLNGPILAQFLQEVEQEEKIALQHQRDFEEQTLRHTALQPKPMMVKADDTPPKPIQIDLTHIPVFEEYV